MRIATYNVEWFNALFDNQAQLLFDDGPSGRYNVSRGQQLAAAGAVFRVIDADLVLVVEAPDQSATRSSTAALEAFAAEFGLRARRALVGFASDTQQEIVVLHDPDRVQLHHAPRATAQAPQFDSDFTCSDPGSGTPVTTRFARAPLELDCLTSEGNALHLIGVHCKSLQSSGRRGRGNDVVRTARLHQYAQHLWLRARIEEHLKQSTDLVVLGDFNNGPETAEIKSEFKSFGLPLIIGDNATSDMRLHDPVTGAGRPAEPPFSARFQHPDGVEIAALLDYILISHGLVDLAGGGRVWDPAIIRDPLLVDALHLASDHFPVTLDIDI